MKIKQVKGIKYKLFEEDELREKLGMSEDNIKIVLDYQVKFPQLTQESDGFCINAENLRVALNMSKVLTAWIKPYTKEDNSYGFMENVDFTSFDADVNPTNGVPIKGYKLTLDMAKELCMISKSTEGKLCRKYFILIEKTLKDYEEWSKVRCPEKQEANNLKSELKKWASKNFMDFNDKNLKTINDTKVIYNPSIARQLLHRGNKIIDIKPDKKDKFKSNFIFNCTDKLLEDLSSITKR